jgi:RNA polymerase sigma factor (sigma-70 family)
MLRHLTGGAEGMALTECSDGQLLERFVTHREEAAFAGLLRRHGPMVLSVCRRTLANEQDREDVFQATFLLLVRKAGSIRRRESVGSWLHGVAHRLAVRCHHQEERRRLHERQAGRERAVSAQTPQAWEELRTLLDEAIAELPEKYRSALVLCYLEDHTHEEAARRLGCRLTTLRSRVARGRERLRIALLRRGLALSSAAFLAALATSAAQAALPPSLRIRTLTAALQFAKGDAVSAIVSASTAALVEGGLRAMSTVKLKVLFVVLLLSGLTLGGAGLLAHQIFGVINVAEPPQPGGEQVAAPPTESKPKPAVDRFGDPPPERAISRLGTIRFRMGGLVCACAWSPDGKTLAAGSANYPGDNTICIFDAATGKPIHQLHGHQYPIISLAFSPDGRILASGSQAAIVLWDPATGKLLRQIPHKPGPYMQVWSLAFTPDGKGLISAGHDGQTHLWDPATGKEIRQFKDKGISVRCAVLSPDGRTLATATVDKEIQLWEMATGKMLRRLTGHKEPIRSLAFSPDGKLLASGSDDFSVGPICLWETATGKVHRRLPQDPKEVQKRQTHNVRTLAFSPDGKTLTAGTGDYGLHLWDVVTGKKLHEMPGTGSITLSSYHDGGIQCVAFSADGKRLVLARDNQLTLLDVASGKEILPMPAHRGGMHRLFFSPDGKRLLTTNDEPGQRILEWDAASGQLIRQIPGKATWANLVRFSPDRTIMISTWNNASLSLWDTATGKEIRRIPIPLESSQTPGDLAFSPDGKLLAVEEASGKAVWLYDPATGKQVCTVEGMSNSASTFLLTFSPDGRILTAADRKAIHLAEVPTGRQLPSIVPPKERYAVAVALSPDGRTLAAPCTSLFNGGLMRLWEVATGKERLSFPEPPGEIRNVAISPDGRLLAAGGFDNDNVIYLWDALTGERLTQLKGHQGKIDSLVFSPDGQRLASGSQDTTALIWDVSGLAKERPRRGLLSRKELNDLWSLLADADAAKAYQAILTLESVPDQAVPLLAERLHLQADDKRISRLLALLDSDDFTERERATKELRELGWAAEPALHRALEGKPSLEVRQRLTELLDGIRKQPLPPQMLRMLRGMEVLEHIGTPQARKVIAPLAEGTPHSRLTREAKAALQRLR